MSTGFLLIAAMRAISHTASANPSPNDIGTGDAPRARNGF